MRLRLHPITMAYYLREHPRALYRVETGTDRVEVWSGDGWRLTSLSVLQLDGLGGDVYQRVKPKDVERVKVARRYR